MYTLPESTLQRRDAAKLERSHYNVKHRLLQVLCEFVASLEGYTEHPKENSSHDIGENALDIKADSFEMTFNLRNKRNANFTFILSLTNGNLS